MKRTSLKAGAKSLERGSTFKADPKPMKRSALRSGGRRRPDEEKVRDALPGREKRTQALKGPRKGRGISPASPAQRRKVAGQASIHCQRPGKPDPAHVIPRGMLSAGQDEALAVVPLCRPCHEAWDSGGLDLLPALERHARRELAFAVERFGLIATLRRVTNDRDAAR